MSFLRKKKNQFGFTILELMVASMISLIVVIGLGQLILTSQKAWGWGADKVELQRNVAESIEWMARSIRSASSLVVAGSEDFTTYDADGNLLHRYNLGLSGGEKRLLEDNSDLVEQQCMDFVVATNADTTSLTLTLELQDDAGNRVAAMTTATLRNRTLEF